MSDKFFFKGRQDTRHNHVKHGYTTNADSKAGSKKYPLALLVTSEARQLEVEAMVAEAALHAIVSLDVSEGAVESIAELTAILAKQGTVKLDKLPGRNDACVCGSGKKYKKCCG